MLIILINNCIDIENNINSIKLLDENIGKANNLKINIKFFPKEEGISEFFESIKIFGEITSFKVFNSNIKFDENLVESWLNNREFKTELLYRKSRDGSTPNDFHNKCDDKGTTIILIETTDGNIFGGYTELSWDTSCSFKKDKSTFIFSFNKKKKYISNNDGNNSIGCYKQHGPIFGGNIPNIYLEGTLEKGKSSNSPKCTFDDKLELTNGQPYWDVKELEVHKIIYI